MSYDLFLNPKSPLLSWSDFAAHFESRTNYTVADSQVWYQNEDTGVYFAFEDNSTNDEQDGDDPAAAFPVLFNLNFLRPTYFAGEAELELTATVEKFEMSVFDSQIDGMETDNYDPAKFFSGWNNGNEAGYASLLKDQQVCYSLPGKELERVWRWNFQRNELQERLGEGIFVPRVIFMEGNGKLFSAIVWSDGIPITFFPVGAIIVYRDELAPRRFFKKTSTTDLIPWDEISSLIDENFSGKDGVYVPNYNNRPDSITQFFLDLKSNPQELSQVPADQVLNRELIEKYAT